MMQQATPEREHESFFISDESITKAINDVEQTFDHSMNAETLRQKLNRIQRYNQQFLYDVFIQNAYSVENTDYWVAEESWDSYTFASNTDSPWADIAEDTTELMLYALQRAHEHEAIKRENTVNEERKTDVRVQKRDKVDKSPIIIVGKPGSWFEGEQAAMRKLQYFIEKGCTPAQAVDYIVTQEYTQNHWASIRGVSQPSISENVTKAKKQLQR